MKRSNLARTIAAGLCAFILAPAAQAVPNFDFKRLNEQMSAYTMILDFTVEVSFGSQSSEARQRSLGTIVDTSGLIVFDGAFLDSEFDGGMPGMTVKTIPTKITASFLSGDEKIDADYLGTDRFTKLGFLRLQPSDRKPLTPVKFVQQSTFVQGSWFATYILLPEFVKPPVAADIGMLATVIQQPETFPLLVGFGPSEIGSVIYNDRLQPVGILGALPDPGSASSDASGMIGSFDQGDFPMLGILSSTRINQLIAAPPTKGKVDRAWLGITMQAVTEDLAELLGVGGDGGVIVTDVISNSPAQKAGVAVGDIIYGIDGAPIPVKREELLPVFQKKIAELQPGKIVAFDIFRGTPPDRKTMTLTAELARAPISATDAQEFEDDVLELGIRDMVFSDFMINNLDQATFSGVVVNKLKSGGLAAIAGLRLGDIIQRVGDQTVSSVGEMKAALEATQAAKPSEIVFFVWRDNRTMFVNVKTK